MAQVAISEIETVTKAALMAHGAGAWQAGEVARATAHSEAHGNVICGLQYVESYCVQLSSGRVDGQVMPVVSRPKAAAILSDARLGFAQPAFAAAKDQFCDLVDETGVAMLAVAQSHTCTSLGYFTEQIAQAGKLCIGFTNASPVVAAPNGKRRVIGTNPIAMSVPDGQGGLSVHFDFSTSAVALGKITMAKYAGEEIPLGWAVDAEGRPTTDPEAALQGALLSAGGYKGWGFGIMAEVLAAAMTGSVNSLDVGGLKLPDGPPHRLGQFYFAMDASTFSDQFGARIARLLEAVAEEEGARVPGQGRVRETSVDVPQALWDKITGLAA
ncbi:Ldh family oxidoreductase [Roseobacter sp. HKCCA0882]|uniref:Ldh family oxidoreductase n=1 Tax=Roseobacter sp. HKCCA0882 TaxID=3120337 RepID=UPI0030EE86D2